MTDIAGATILLGNATEKMTYSQVAKGRIPYKRRNGRIIFLVDELRPWLEALPGVSVKEAIENSMRGDDDD